ncbi:MAG: integrin alpha [Amaricoccus sp.]
MALNLNRLDGTNGFRLDGLPCDDSGWSVAGAGDINGDGINDLVIGAPSSCIGLTDKTYVLFGTSAGFNSTVDLPALTGDTGFVIEGDYIGHSVDGAFDVNGDGIDDLIIGAQRANGFAGASYVVFGSSAGFGATLELSSLDGSNGFRLDGSYYSGKSVAGAGDINGDGIDDLIVGAPQAGRDDAYEVGKSYVVFGSAAGFRSSLDLSRLDGMNGFSLLGVEQFEGSGWSVDGIGDFNGDGIDDLVIGSGHLVGPSRAYVVFGSTEGFGASVDLGTLDGADGFRIDGGGSWSVAGAGDVNGDGLDDLVIGDFWGSSYLVFGSPTSIGESLDLSTLDGTNGFRIAGAGYSVAGAGDVNGDGFDDIIVGAPGYGEYPGSSVGESYVVFGSSGGFAAEIDLSTISGRSGFRLTGIDSYDYTGHSVAGAGDVNGDGIDDLIVGAPGEWFDAGKSYLLFGSVKLGGPNDPPSAAKDVLHVDAVDIIDLTADNGAGFDRDPDFDDLVITEIDGTPVALGDTVDLASGLRVTLVGRTEVRLDAPGATFGTSITDCFIYGISDGHGGSDTGSVSVEFRQKAIPLDMLDGTDGSRINGVDHYDYSGDSVAGAGDINGDGFDDVLIGSPNWYYYSNESGISYVVFGSASEPGQELQLAELDGTNGFRVNGPRWFGDAVAGVGDINADGFDDLAIVSPGAVGAVLFGSAEFAATLDLAALDGTNGFSFARSGPPVIDWSSASAAGAGDVNGDGLDDLLVAATGAHQAFVVFGSTGRFEPSIDLAALDGKNGFRIDGINASPDTSSSVAGAGDVNGDGIDDLIIGVASAATSYVLFGTPGPHPAAVDLAALDASEGFRIDGAGTAVAGAGDVNGDHIDDLIVGGAGGSASYVVFGARTGFGADIDVVSLTGANGFRIDGGGTSVAGAGDFNGDGLKDLIVGAPGESYIVFGSRTGFQTSLDLSDLDGTNGLRLAGVASSDGLGWSVSTAGDVNDDGFDDVVLGAPNTDRFTGASYVVFGFSGGPAPILGGPGLDVLTGTAADEAFYPGGGHDFVTTGAGSDEIHFNDIAGSRDILTIADFDPESDTLDLGGAEVKRTLVSDRETVLLLDGADHDAIVLLGVPGSAFDSLG